MKCQFKYLVSFCLSLIASCAFAEAQVEKLAKDDWLLVKTKNFEIVTDMDEDDGRGFAEDLENYRAFSIGVLHRNLISKLRPLKVLAVGSSSNFKKLGFPEMWAGVFRIDEFGYNAVANVKDYRRGLKNLTFGRQVLFHEYNHFLVTFLDVTTIFPIWYNEGAAEYFATFKYDGSKIYLGDRKAIEFRTNGLYSASGNINIQLEKLFKTTDLPLKSDKEKDKSDIADFYGRAFFVVHYFNSSAELREQLESYLRLIAQGYSEDIAFQQAFRTDYVEMEKRIKHYLVHGMALRVIGIEGGKISFPPVDIQVTKLDEAGFYREVYDVLLSHEDPRSDASKRLLEKTASLNPDLLDVKVKKLMRGFSDNSARDFELLDKSENKTALFLYFQGMNYFYAANTARAAGENDWVDEMKVARSYFRKAIKADPSATYVYGALGDVYKFLPVTEPLKEGQVCLDTATVSRRQQNAFTDLALINIRLNAGLDALPSAQSAVAFTKEKNTVPLLLLRDNLEILHDASKLTGTVSAKGLIYTDGSYYEGPLSNNKPHGKGKLVRPNGAYFEGDFVDGIMQGLGKLVSSNDYSYEGEFKQGIARGKGRIDYPHATYVGDVDYTLRNGKGIYIEDGITYDGEFWYGYKQGNGILKVGDEKILAQGKWIEDRYQWPEENGIVFTGFVTRDGKRDGYGVCRTTTAKSLRWCRYETGVSRGTADQIESEKN